jgi:hypothetical protein
VDSAATRPLATRVLAAALVVVAVVFVRRMNDPDESMEQMLYKTNHPTRRTR